MKVFFLAALIFFGAYAVFVFAEEKADIYFAVPEGAIAPQSEFTVRVLVKSNEPVNAASFAVLYSSDVLELLKIYTGPSFIDFWIEGPYGNLPGIISGQGGARIPFTGEDGVLLELDFKASAEGTAQISIPEAELYYADGKGTRVDAGKKVRFIDISPGGKVLGISRAEDREPPKLTDFQIAKNPIEGVRMVVFNAQDSGAGTREAYFRERIWFTWSEWQEVNSPARLQEGAWMVQVRITDNAGNETVETQYIGEEIIKKLLYIGVFLVILLGVYMGINRLRRKDIS